MNWGAIVAGVGLLIGVLLVVMAFALSRSGQTKKAGTMRGASTKGANVMIDGAFGVMFLGAGTLVILTSLFFLFRAVS